MWEAAIKTYKCHKGQAPGLGWALLLTQAPRQLQEGQGASGGSVIFLGYSWCILEMYNWIPGICQPDIELLGYTGYIY